MIIQIVLWDCYTVPYFCFEKRRFMEELKFEELELCPEILKAVKHMGFEEASPIQSKAIPVIMTIPNWQSSLTTFMQQWLKRCDRTGADRNRKNSSLWNPASGKD